MHLLGLLLYTVMFVLAQGTFMFFFLKMIENGGALDVIFRWQKMLDYMYGHKYKAIDLLGKALGICDMCCCFWLSGLSFFVYRWLAVSLDIYTINGWGILIWCWMYWGLSAFYSYWFVTKASDNGL